MEEIIRYWGKIAFPIVLKKSIGDSGMKLAFWVFILSAITACVFVALFLLNVVSTNVVDFTIEQFKNYAYAFCFSIFIAFLSFLGLLFTVPPEINKTKENEINKLDDELHSVTPNIQLQDNVNIRDVWMMGMPTTEVITYPISLMVSVPFANNPESPNSYNSAKSVRAEITYLDENKRPLFKPITGRWDNPQYSYIMRGTKKVRETDFPNHGEIQWLDLLLKYPEDEYCYAYNNDSLEAPYYQHPEYQITSKNFFVHIRLRGAHIPNDTWEFEVETKGIGDTFRIRRNGEEWQGLKNSQAIKHPNQKPAPVKKKSSPKRTSSKH